MHDFQQQPTHHAYPAASNAPVNASDTSKGLDVREVIWLKLQVLKDEYLQDMEELYNMLTQRSAMPLPPEKLQKLKHYKDVLQRMIPYLTVAKERVPVEFNEDKARAFEKQIVLVLQTFKRRKLIPPQQPGPLSQQHLHAKEALQSVKEQHAQLQQQWQQQLWQQEMLQQQQEVLPKHLLQQQHAQLQQQWQQQLWQQEMLQQQQKVLQQQQRVLQKHLLQQQQLFQQLFQQQQKVLQEQQQQEDLISDVTRCFSRLPLN